MNRIEHYKLILERTVTTDCEGNINKYEIIVDKDPIVFTASRMFTESVTDFPKQQNIKDITKYLCDKMMEHVNHMGDSEIEEDENETTRGMYQTIIKG